MSIWDDIEKAQILTKSTLTAEDMLEFIEAYQVKSNTEEREWHVVTGSSGMAMIETMMQAQIYFGLMKNLNFSREERKRLGELINSSDRENFGIAKIIIDNKVKEAKEYHK